MADIDTSLLHGKKPTNSCSHIVKYFATVAVLILSFVMSLLLIINKLYYKFANNNLTDNFVVGFAVLNICMQIMAILSNNIILIIGYRHQHGETTCELIMQGNKINTIRLILFFLIYNIVFTILFRTYELDSSRIDTFIPSMILNNIEAIQMVLIYYNLNFIWNKERCGPIFGHKWMFNLAMTNLLFHICYDFLVSIIDTETYMVNKDLVFRVFFSLYTYFYQWFITYIGYGIGKKLFVPDEIIQPTYQKIADLEINKDTDLLL